MDPTGQFGIGTALGSAGLNLAVQLGYNFFGRNLGLRGSLMCIDYLDVLTSGLIGFVSPGWRGVVAARNTPWFAPYLGYQLFNTGVASQLNKATPPTGPFGPALPGPRVLDWLSIL